MIPKPVWWNGIHGGFKTHCREACEFDSRRRYKDKIENGLVNLVLARRLRAAGDGVPRRNVFKPFGANWKMNPDGDGSMLETCEYVKAYSVRFTLLPRVYFTLCVVYGVCSIPSSVCFWN